MTRNGARSRRLTLVAVLTLLALLMSASVASAHEHREVGGYELTVGFMNEPALVEEPNGLDLRVAHVGEAGHGHGDEHEAEPVEGLANTLQAEIIYGDQTMPLTLRAVYNQPGAYTADVIPTEEGTYSFRIFGTIEDTEVDETFVGGPDTFSEVGSKAEISFPSESQTVGSVALIASDASDTANSAQTFGIAGVVVGALGVLIGAAGFATARNSRTSASGSSRVARSEADA